MKDSSAGGVFTMAKVINTDSSKKKNCARGNLCINCLRDLLPATVDYFRPKKNGRYGLRAICRECEAYLRRTPEHRSKRKAYLSSVAGLSSIGQSESKVERREYVKQWKKEEHYRTQQGEYRKTSGYIESQKRYKESKDWKVKARILVERRLSRKKNLPDNFTIEDWKFALVFFENRCAVCGRQENEYLALVMDHWIPLSSQECSGTIPSNIVPLCHTRKGCRGAMGCNNSKINKNPVDWLNQSFKGKALMTINRINEYFTIVKR